MEGHRIQKAMVQSSLVIFCVGLIILASFYNVFTFRKSVLSDSRKNKWHASTVNRSSDPFWEQLLNVQTSRSEGPADQTTTTVSQHHTTDITTGRHIRVRTAMDEE